MSSAIIWGTFFTESSNQLMIMKKKIIRKTNKKTPRRASGKSKASKVKKWIKISKSKKTKKTKKKKR
jgi:hypothetical protein